ncbi:MAG: hypothetical protein M3Z23_06950 [Acidobacteriota bacterium]|nr:hypothetical protein [Acidobacteriota bacterium]
MVDRTPASDLWRNTLSQIPTLFGRLQYLASLRDPNTGEYRHFGLSQRFSGDAADEVLRDSHLRIFAEWLCLHLERQKADIEEYLEGLEGDKKTILASWSRLNSLRACVPAETRDVERKLFLSDLQTILELLRYEHAVVLPDPNA